MTLDGKALAKACGAEGAPVIASQLCRAQIDNFRDEIARGGSLSDRFLELTHENAA